MIFWQSQFEANETKECLPLIKRVELRVPLLLLTVWILIGNLTVVISKLCQACGQSACRKFPRDMPTISLGLCYFYQVIISKLAILTFRVHYHWRI